MEKLNSIMSVVTGSKVLILGSSGLAHGLTMENAVLSCVLLHGTVFNHTVITSQNLMVDLYVSLGREAYWYIN
jgi:hypothetical protein